MLLVLVVQALFLDLVALVHDVHRAQRAVALTNGLELSVDELFQDGGQFVHDEAALPRGFAEV